MSACERFEREGLLRLERGLPLDEHFTTCPDCRQAQAAYERLGREIAMVGAEHEPPIAWQARVWARIEGRRERRTRTWWPRLAVPAALAAALVAVLLVRPMLRGPAPAALQVSVERGDGPVRRGVEAQPGDRLVLAAGTGDAPYAELRVYRNDSELVLRCSEEPPCRRDGETLTAALELPSIGIYQGLLLTSGQPIPEPSSDLDGDAGAALVAGAEVELGAEVRVR